MPNLNGMGPEGKGSKTGRAMGKCDGASKQASIVRGCRRPAGRGLGLGQKGNSVNENKN